MEKWQSRRNDLGDGKDDEEGISGALSHKDLTKFCGQNFIRRGELVKSAFDKKVNSDSSNEQMIGLITYNSKGAWLIMSVIWVS